MQHKIIIPTGYMGSGSSAVTDLLREVEGYSCENGEFEYVFLHCPNGLFDLEDKLIMGNNAFRSDEALHSFYSCMLNLYKNKHYWVANYKERVSPRFIEWCEEFIESLVDEKTKNVHWYYQENPTPRIYLKKIMNKVLRILTLGNVGMKPGLRYHEMWLSYPDRQEFYEKAKIFLGKFYSQMGLNRYNVVLDQFVLPHNLYRMHNYFEDNCKVIVVDRDPRDVFLLNKYYWSKINIDVPLSFNVENYCHNFDRIRCMEIRCDSQNIKRVHFEDLVYRYDETVQSIFSFLSINKNMHVRQFHFFDPEKSRLNTQIFNRSKEHMEEVEYIEKHLNKYLYNFPVLETKALSHKEIIV